MGTDPLNNFIMNNKSILNELNIIFDNCQRLKKYKMCAINKFSDNCSTKIIKAHSISKSAVLKNISTKINGKHVLGYFKKTKPIEPTPLLHRIREKYIDINSALTFTGLCKFHDNTLFENIDKNPFDLSNPQIIFEYTLRNCIYSYYNRLSNTKGIDESLKYLKSKQFDFSHIENIPANTIATEKNIIYKDLEKLCNNLYSEDRFNIILYKIIPYEGNINIAGCLYNVHKDEASYITILPGIVKSYIIISAIKKDNILQKNGFFQFVRSIGIFDFEHFLSEKLLQATEINSYVFNYDKFQTLDDSIKDTIYTWLDFENMDKIYEDSIRYEVLGEVPNFIQIMLDK